MKLKVKSLIQHTIIITSFFPLTCIYRMIYKLAVAVAAFSLRSVNGVLTIYLRRGVAQGDIIYGLSDIDLLLIVNDKGGDLAKEKVRATYDKLSQFIPLFASGDRELGVYTSSEFFNLYDDYPFYRHRFNEGKYTWKLLSGTDIVKDLPKPQNFELYLPATEELKAWWALLNIEFRGGLNHHPFERKYLWYKAISEAAKIYLFINHGKKIRNREAAICELRNHVDVEYQSCIDKLQFYIRHLTVKEDLPLDDLMKLFVTLVDWSFTEAERKVYGNSKGKKAIINIPDFHEIVPYFNLAYLTQKFEATVIKELEPYIDYMAMIPQIEFNIDVLDNSDIDSLYMVLVQKSYMPVALLRRFLAFFEQYFGTQNIGPFIVTMHNIAVYLRDNNPFHCIKSPGSYPLFFSLVHNEATKFLEGHTGASGPIYYYLPPATFEETIRKRVLKINAIISDSNIYKMKPLNYLRFFWAAARTKLLAPSLAGGEIITIPLSSKQILDILVKSYPDDSDWLHRLHIEYTRELVGDENESHRFIEKSIAFLNRM